MRGARFFFFADFEQLHKHTYMRQNTRLCKYPHKHSDLGLKRELNSRKRKCICNSNLAILDPDFGLKGEAVQYSFCLSFMLIITHCKKISHCSWLNHFCNFNENT